MEYKKLKIVLKNVFDATLSEYAIYHEICTALTALDEAKGGELGEKKDTDTRKLGCINAENHRGYNTMHDLATPIVARLKIERDLAIKEMSKVSLECGYEVGKLKGEMLGLRNELEGLRRCAE